MLSAGAQNRFKMIMPVIFLCMSSCTSGFLQTKSDSDESSEPEESEDTKADEPVQVTGTFLTVLCDAQGFTVDNNNSIGDDPVVSCLIKNDDGTRYEKPLSSVKSEVFFGDGSPITAETQISENPPWHFYIKMSEEDRKKVAKGNFEIVSDEETENVQSEEFDYKWFEDPLFAFLVIALKAQPDEQRVSSSIAKWIELDQTFNQFIFVSDQIFPGNMGLENADSYCDLEGKKLVADRTWRSLLSTSKESAFQRIPITKPVINVFGELISFDTPTKSTEDIFWSDLHAANLKMTQTGKQTNLYDDFNGRLRVYDTVWTGTNQDGALDEEWGNCNDWGSVEPGVTSGIGDTTEKTGVWVRSKKVDCSTYARIMCISL